MVAPSRVAQLQRALGNRGVARLVRAGAARQTLQRRHVNVVIAGLAGGNASGQYAPMNLQAQGQIQRFSYQMRRWDLQLPHVATRGAAIVAEQAWLAANAGAIGGQNAQQLSNTAVVRPAAQMEESINGRNLGTQTQANFWPFVLRMRSTYGAPAVAREVDVQFAQDKYGYITRLSDGNQVFEMQVPPDLLGVLFFPDNAFSSFHAADPGGARDVRVHGEAMQDIHDADDQTKVIAEGARWQGVAAKAAAGGLTDQSRFYASVNAAGAPWGAADAVPYVTLADLWTQWNKFQRGWNVANPAVRALLLGPGAANFRSGQDTFLNLQGGAANYAV